MSAQRARVGDAMAALRRTDAALAEALSFLWESPLAQRCTGDAAAALAAIAGAYRADRHRAAAAAEAVMLVRQLHAELSSDFIDAGACGPWLAPGLARLRARLEGPNASVLRRVSSPPVRPPLGELPPGQTQVSVSQRTALALLPHMMCVSPCAVRAVESLAVCECTLD